MKMTLSLIGTGAMSKALALGLASSYTLEIVGRTQEKAQNFIKENNLDAKSFALDDFDISGKHIIFCVKPYALEPVAKLLKGKADTIYSILAGTKISTLKASLDAKNYIRVMPNVAAGFGTSMTTLTGDASQQKASVEIFSCIGQALWLGSEKELDIATGLAGSGPAYLALIAEALADGAVKQGLKRPDAMQLTQGLFKGFASLIENEHPALIKDSVMSPGGTTAAGYSALEKAGVRSGCIDAIEAAYQKTL